MQSVFFADVMQSVLSRRVRGQCIGFAGLEPNIMFSYSCVSAAMLAPGYHNTWYICKLVGWLAAGAAAAPERPDTADQLLGGPIELWGQLGSAAMVAVLAAVLFSTRCSSNALRQLDQIDQ